MIYFDNSSTSFPKAPLVAENIFDFIKNHSVNINRGSYNTALNVEETVYECRMKLAKLFAAKDCKNIIFTNNITTSLNMILKGYLKHGDHVIISEMEHNAIIRPLTQLKKINVSYSTIPIDKFGNIRLEEVEKLIQENTKAIICTHVSNVCGIIMPIEKLGKIAKKYKLEFIVDSAQSAGVLEINVEKMNISALCFTGHKALLGPQGIGGFYISDEFSKKVESIISGGTGSFSDLDTVPELLPDKFEAGTLNLPGIIGLNTALNFINKIGINNIYEHEMKLTKHFLNGLEKLDKVKILANNKIKNKTAVVSIDIENFDLAYVSHILDKNYSIQVRTGLHCSPHTHKALNSFPKGSIRFSFSYFNSIEEVDFALNALEEIITNNKETV